MRLIIIIFAFLYLLQKLLIGAEVRLTIDPSPSSNFVAFYVANFGPTSRGTNNDTFSYPFVALFSTNLTVTITNLNVGITYFSARAVSTNNLFSFYSNEIAYTNRDFAPIVLRLSGPVQGLRLMASEDNMNWNLVAVYTNTPIQMAIRQKQFLKTATIHLPPFP